MSLSYESKLNQLISGITQYLVETQETDGKSKGSFWSELAYHVPYFDYHAGGSNHERTVGSAGLAFCKLSTIYPEVNLLKQAEIAFDWVITQQHSDGGLFEITNNNKPSQFHLEYERSTISLGMVVHGLFNAFNYGLDVKREYKDFILKAAHWQMTVEVDPGNFLHSEGYPNYLNVLNATAHAAENLLIAAKLTENETDKAVWVKGADRAISALLAAQRNNGMFPYKIPSSPGDKQETILYSATVAWIFQNLIDSKLLNSEKVLKSLISCGEFLSLCIKDDGSIDWDNWENHGQKYHTWAISRIARTLRWFNNNEYNSQVKKTINFMYDNLYDSTKRLPRLLDFPLGETRIICRKSVKCEKDFECAFDQADMLDCLIDLYNLETQCSTISHNNGDL